MTKMFSLENRVALVTGASRGLGLAMARALKENGAHVIINARDAAALATAATSIGAQPLAFDVSDSAVARKALEAIVKEHGHLDILVNNAGIQHRKPLVEWEDDDFDRVISVNLTSCFRLARDAARLMLPQKFGRIINTGSVAAILGRPTIHAYVAAKAGLHGLTRSMAAELGRHGITINALAPGYVVTELTRPLVDDPAFDSWIRGRTPAGRWATVEDLVGTLVWLAAPASDFVNGQVIAVDGGLTAVV